MAGVRDRINESWNILRKSAGFRNLLTFLVFVAIATVFWLVMALNDNVQKNVTFRFEIENVPDSVTFIDLPPARIHVLVRDRGTSLLRVSGFRHPSVRFNFKDFSNDGVFRLTSRDIQASLKSSFGASATILSNSLDSLRLHYTTGKGKTVPIVVVSELASAPGHIIGSNLQANIGRATVYGDRNVLDTLTRVFTRRIVKSNLSESTNVEVALTPISGVRIEPARVNVHIPVEPLVAKDFYAHVDVRDVPDDESLIIFPSRVKVSCFVPMSKFALENLSVELYVSYNDLHPGSTRLPVRLGMKGKEIFNPTLAIDSLEYTIVR